MRLLGLLRPAMGRRQSPKAYRVRLASIARLLDLLHFRRRRRPVPDRRAYAPVRDGGRLIGWWRAMTLDELREDMDRPRPRRPSWLDRRPR